MICPDCKGEKTTIASHVSYSDGAHGYGVPCPCLRCRSTPGEVDDRTPQWIEAGRALKAARMKPYRNLLTEAKRRGVDVTILSRMELGYIEPLPAEPDIDPMLPEVNCRVCGKFEKPWVWWSCKKCGITGEVRKEIVRRFLEEQEKENT